MCNSASLLGFLVELLKSSVAMQEQMLGGKGFLVIGYLLERVGATVFFPPHFSQFCVLCIFPLTSTLGNFTITGISHLRNRHWD